MKSKHCHEVISLLNQCFDDKLDTTEDFPMKL